MKGYVCHRGRGMSLGTCSQTKRPTGASCFYHETRQTRDCLSRNPPVPHFFQQQFLLKHPWKQCLVKFLNWNLFIYLCLSTPNPCFLALLGVQSRAMQTLLFSWPASEGTGEEMPQEASPGSWGSWHSCQLCAGEVVVLPPTPAPVTPQWTHFSEPRLGATTWHLSYTCVL